MRIAYVDHSFHQQTKSTAFLPEILTKHGHQVEFFWDEGWNGGRPVAWSAVKDFDVVIMFQSYCPPDDDFFRLAHPNVIYIPMLDQFGLWRGPLYNLSDFWEPFHGSKVLNFSNSLHYLTKGFGIASHYAKYYQRQRDNVRKRSGELNGFFWLRRESELPWQLVRELIGDTKFDSLHIHLASDPGSASPVEPGPEDVARHNITVSRWFDDKSDLDRIIDRANVFFAPRQEEGIGQSFLEAMARGQCVVAPNHGTMNEYILSGINGFLYDPNLPSPIDFRNADQIGDCALGSVIEGRAQWEASEQALVDFIVRPSDEFYVGGYRHPALQSHRMSGLSGEDGSVQTQRFGFVRRRIVQVLPAAIKRGLRRGKRIANSVLFKTRGS